MTKLLQSLSVMFAVASAGTLAAGCDLYFGDSGNSSGDQWNYCGADGYYTCTGDDNCTLVSSTCPGGSDECRSNTDCAAGCFCGSGTCTESGFCGSDGDCGSGYVCDTSRSTCEPGQPKCGSDADCASGSVCDANTGACDATCTCTTDADAQSFGFGWCDTTRQTCETGENPNGSCAGTVTCGTQAPSCPDNQVPLILDGCWTGTCQAIASCTSAPSCGDLQHEDDCLGRSDCDTEYTGHNCQTPSGQSCTTPGANCTCESFTFAACQGSAN